MPSTRILFAALACAALASCASPDKNAAAVDADGKKIEYVYYTPTGSNIPIKVRKDQVQPSESETASDQAALRRVIQQSRHQDKSPGGG